VGCAQAPTLALEWPMRLHPVSTLVCSVLLCATLNAQLQIKKVTEPFGKTLDKALKESLLIQPGAKPFHIKLTISQSKSSDTTYSASIEETWVTPTEWVRTIRAMGVSETIVVNATGTHYVSSGDYLPAWLRGFVTGLFDPVPDVGEWNRTKPPVEHMETPRGNSSPCIHSEFFLGIPPVQQINFANVCFKDGLVQLAQSSDYSMEFKDYTGFGKLKVPLTLISHRIRGVELDGKIVTLEPAKVDANAFATPPGAQDKDPFPITMLKADQLTTLAGGSILLPWPNITPGRGMFTSWVVLDTTGTVREVSTLNTDESGFAGDMTAKLLGQHWKPWVVDGQPVQAEGAVVFAYPPVAAPVATPK